MPASAIRWLLLSIDMLGLERGPLLAEAGIDPEASNDPDLEVPLDASVALRELLEEVTPDPAFALRASKAMRLGMLGVVDYACASSPTMGASMECLSRYFRLLSSAGARLELARQGRLTTLELSFPAAPLPVWLVRQSVEFTFGRIVVEGRSVSRLEFPVDRLELAYPRPSHADAYTEVFGPTQLCFGRERNLLCLDAEVMLLPCHTGDEMLHQLLVHRADVRLDDAQGGDSLVDAVRDAVAAELRGGHPTIEHVAGVLGLGPRTLHRRLAAEGTSFTDLRDALRHQSALAYLRDRSLSVGEVSFLLGFSEPSAFHRAFKRWEGMPPQRFRRATWAVSEDPS